MSKNTEIHDSILSQALDLSSELGLEGLTIGALAKCVGMSKSGLYAHFASKEDLQTQILDEAAQRFSEKVLKKAIQKPRGIQRVQALFECWLDWSTNGLTGGCPFIAAAIEYDDRTGPVRDKLVHHLEAVLDQIARAASIAMQEGHFRKNLDLEQFAYEFWSNLLAFHHFHRLMRAEDARKKAHLAFERLLEAAKQP